MTQPATARDDDYVLTLEEIGALASEGGKPDETLIHALLRCASAGGDGGLSILRSHRLT